MSAFGFGSSEYRHERAVCATVKAVPKATSPTATWLPFRMKNRWRRLRPRRRGRGRGRVQLRWRLISPPPGAPAPGHGKSRCLGIVSDGEHCVRSLALEAATTIVGDYSQVVYFGAEGEDSVQRLEIVVGP